MKPSVIVSAALAICTAFAAPARAAADTVEMTWMSIANWYFKISDKRIMMDAYITRVPEGYAPPREWERALARLDARRPMRR